MNDLFIILIVLAVVCLACGPIALIVSIAALNRARRTYSLPEWKEQELRREPAWSAPVTTVKTEPAKEERPMQPVEPVGGEKEEVAPEITKIIPKPIWESKKVAVARETIALEQRIGTRWVLIAGVIAVIFAMGFFLKYAYDNKWIGPLGRVVIAAITGLGHLWSVKSPAGVDMELSLEGSQRWALRYCTRQCSRLALIIT